MSRSLSYHSGLRPMFGGDVADAAGMLGQLAERMSYEMQGTPSLEEREKAATELLQGAVRTGSNVLDRMNHRSWGDLGAAGAARAATALAAGLAECAFLLAAAVTAEKIIVKPTDNIRTSSQENFFVADFLTLVARVVTHEWVAKTLI